MKEGWREKDIEQCFKVKSGNFLPAKTMVKGGTIDVYGGNGITGKHNQYNLTGENIIIGRVGAKCGNVNRVNGNIWVTDNAFYISEFLEEFDLSFLEYLLTVKNLRDKANHSAQPVISYTTIKNTSLIIPPLSEQKRIVSIVDKAFEGIDRAIVNTEKNLINARELFESYLNSIFTQNDEGWEEKTLGEVCTLQRGFDLPKQNRLEGDYPLVSSSGITDNHLEAKVQGPGVVTGRSGSIGNVFYINQDFWPLNTVLYVKDFHGNDIEFVYHLLKQFDLQKYAGGTGVPTLNRNNVHSVKVKIPRLINVQKKIVMELNDLYFKTQHLESIYKQKLSALKELKQSILQKAFTGELTADTANQTIETTEDAIV